jgi:hypothetical protein
MENFKITRYKSASEVSWLKDIHIALVDTYFIDMYGDKEDLEANIATKEYNL